MLKEIPDVDSDGHFRPSLINGFSQRVESFLDANRIIETGMLIFDVGANTGKMTSVFLEFGCSVICIEPVSLCLDHLRAKFKDSDKVYVVPKAVSSAFGRKPITYYSSNTDWATLSEDWMAHYYDKSQVPDRNEKREWEVVDITTLDQLIDEFGIPGYCKIDVEGMEHLVIRGLSHPVPCISYEFCGHFCKEATASIRRLSGLGPYRYNITLEDRFDRMQLPTWLSGTEAIQYIERRVNREADLWGDVYARLDL